MSAEGKNQAEIAAVFGVSDRTIRAWLSKARDMRLGTFRSLGAEDALAEAEESIRALEAVAWANLRTATAANYGRQAVLWVREIADLIDRRLSLHERIGAFDHLRADRQAERELRQDAAMGIARPGVFEDDVAWGEAVAQALAGTSALASFDIPPDPTERHKADRARAAQDAEIDRVLRARGINPADFDRAAKEGVFREMAEKVFGAED